MRWGPSVHEGADLRSQLAASGKQVMTLGMNANGPEFELAGLMEYGRYLKPKIVLWLYYEGNDLQDLAENSKYPIVHKYLEGNFSQDLMHRQDEIDKDLLGFYEKYA